MAERSGGNVPSSCVRCRKPLPEPGVRSCDSCGASQQQMRECVAGGATLVAGNAVPCVNPQCQTPLLPTMMFCFGCGTRQLQGNASFYQVSQSQGDPSYVQETHSEGHTPPKGIHDRGYPEMGPQTASKPYSPGTQREPQVNECNIL